MNNIAKYIDHTFLKKDATSKEIEKVCLEAMEYGFYGVCLYPKFLSVAKKILKKNGPKLIAVVDFPNGDGEPHEKGLEAKDAIEKGAEEIDFVIDVLALKDQNYKKVFDGMKSVVDSSKGVLVKAIIETAYLNYDDKIIACALAKAAGVTFIKTSTGLKGGATVADIALIKKIIGENMYIKASGGIKTAQDALSMINAGASRIGTSSSLKILAIDS
ncbi:MAG: deoxyribose-phosphate aldolase [Chlamydiae bacterium RIFCSPHIGHO2_12_FULL_27_8]|nr:MAG: deoxyribose-phosphate aldolase [Chlamydiae bacterium RIFCSPHIGHO2_12_FULL_27_8]